MADERGGGRQADQAGQVEALREELRKAEEEIANLQQAQQAAAQSDPAAGVVEQEPAREGSATAQGPTMQSDARVAPEQGNRGTGPTMQSDARVAPDQPAGGQAPGGGGGEGSWWDTPVQVAEDAGGAAIGAVEGVAGPAIGAVEGLAGSVPGAVEGLAGGALHDTVEGVAGEVRTGEQALGDVGSAAGQVVSGNLAEGAVDVGRAGVDAVTGTVSTATNVAGDALDQGAHAVGDVAGGVVGGVLGSEAGGLVSGVIDEVGDIGKGTLDLAGGAVHEVGAIGESVASGVAGLADDAVGAVASGAQDVASDVGSGVEDAASDVADAASSAASDVEDAASSAVDSVEDLF